MLRPSLLSFYVPFTECFLSFLKGVLPRRMWLITPRHDGDEIFYRAAKDTHCRRKFCLWIRCVAVLEHGNPERISVQCSSGRDVGFEQSLDCFDSDLGPTVGVWKCNRRLAVMNSPGFHEALRGRSSEFRSPVCGKLVWDAKSHERLLQDIYQTLRSARRPFHDRPIRVAINNNEIVLAAFHEEVGADLLELVRWRLSRCWWGTRIGR